MYAEYRPKLERYIGQRVSDPALAEDLTAQVFIKAIEADGNKNGAHSSLSGWLYRIAHNLVVDTYRARAAHPVVELSDTHPAGDDPAHRALAAVDRAALLQAIHRLPGDQGAVVRLRLDGFGFDEIAGVLGNTTGAVKALQHRAWNGLRLLLSRPATVAIDGTVRRRVRVATGERTCVLCGETTMSDYCPRCNLDDAGKSTGRVRLVETASYLRPEEWEPA